MIVRYMITIFPMGGTGKCGLEKKLLRIHAERDCFLGRDCGKNWEGVLIVIFQLTDT